MKSIYILCVLFSSCLAANVISTSFGSSVSVQGGEEFELNFGGVSSLVLMLNQNATVSVSLFLNSSLSLPFPSNGIAALSFGSNLGFSFQVSPSNVEILYSNFTTPPIVNTDLITANANPNCLYYDPNINFYDQLDVVVESQSLEQQIVVPLPSSGIYIFVVIDVGTPLPTFYGRERQLPAGQQKQFVYPFGLSLEVTSNSNTSLIANFTETVYVENPINYIPLNAFFEFTEETETSVNATISYAYNKTEVLAKKIVESTLRIAFYDVINSTWVFLESGGNVDISASIVSQTTTHFSTWGVYGNEASTSGSSNMTSTTTGNPTGTTGTTGTATSISISLFLLFCSIISLIL